MALPCVPWVFSASSRAPRSFSYSSGLGQVALNISHLVCELLPRRLVDMVNVELRRRIADEAFQHVVKVVAPVFGRSFRSGHTDHRELLRQQLCA